MKKKVVFIAALICVALLLAACTPDGGELREAYKGAGYDFQPFDISAAHVEEYELSDYFSAVKGANSDPKTVYVLFFATLGEARRYVEEHSGSGNMPNLSRSGRLVAFGAAEAVSIAVGS
ncbi:MAG TPA: hypothetical protein H9677_04385 [Firmicutes bacterium]|nr:hypothetical protein [Bacillota bacterium]